MPRELFYRLTVINALAYAVLTVFAFVCWIKAPQLNGVVGTVAFTLAACLIAREQSGSGQLTRRPRANWKKWGLPELNDPNRNPKWKYFDPQELDDYQADK